VSEHQTKEYHLLKGMDEKSWMKYMDYAAKDNRLFFINLMIG
jgi:hypothetical protein